MNVSCKSLESSNSIPPSLNEVMDVSGATNKNTHQNTILTPTPSLLYALHPGYSGVSKTALEDWPVQKILPSNTRSTCHRSRMEQILFPRFGPHPACHEQ